VEVVSGFDEVYDVYENDENWTSGHYLLMRQNNYLLCAIQHWPTTNLSFV